MKRIVIIAFAFLLLVGFSNNFLAAQTNEQFGISSDRSGGVAGIRITSYTGTTGTVAIPGEMNRIPVRVIGSEVFRGKRVFSVTIPASVVIIGDAAFSDNFLTAVTIPNNVTTIGNLAFSNNLLTTITIPNNVTSIGMDAFGSNLITSITIGSNVKLSSNGSGLSSSFVGVYNGEAGTYIRPDANSADWTKRD